MMPDAEQRGIPANPFPSARAPRELLTAIWDQSSDPASPWPLSRRELEEIFRDAHSRGPGSGIDPERLAGLMAGILSDEQRQEALELLSTDETAYQQFLAVARYRVRKSKQASPAQDTERAGAHVPSSLPEGRGRWRRWLPLAAAAAVLLVAGAYVMQQISTPLAPPSAELLAASGSGRDPHLGGFEIDRLRLRGAQGVSPAARAARFEIGVRTTDLLSAVQAGDRDAAERWRQEIVRLLETAILLGEIEAQPYEELAPAFGAAPDLRDLLGPVSAAEASLASIDGWPELHFGRWIEASRLAARAESRAYFASRRLYLKPLNRFRRIAASDEVKSRLGDLPGQVDESPDFASIEDQLTGILEHCLLGRPCLKTT